ncbi:uncharacterized protein M421DRAFT_415527 [Didymella exigua CBS 183.55]|uniref:GDP/GTP exchange factor Sec2 N-terminal domain-containing protein n=1 Tax=Didymella exigua CBS 183.55 TaxID=1150837 RepID=A0A6A5RZX4_9PLEO|nr:uncharacterized protein M421DRAFT_415527 [Didymella exigua CBS 183.55]KAF1933163.1 hypothetical protein M421DRAFT_415527 [Didymella exigua CBS 183.55]
MSVEIQPPSELASSTRNAQAASTAHSCPSCGTLVALDFEGTGNAARLIRELQAQMEVLREKATAAVNKCTDYEDQIRTLKIAPSSNSQPVRSNTSDSVNYSSPDNRPPTTTPTHARSQSRFSFLTGRLTSPVNSTTAPPVDSTTVRPVPAGADPDPDLLHELERERALRAKAEDRVRTVDSEIEELSVTLFSQANEMVAEERRARAKLEQRIELLEKKDRDKMGRLDRLEKAVSRLDRVKAMLGKDDTMSTASKALPAPPRD